ncbi:MAG: CbbQ/NirQ/NorQ/GpvN family protein [Deltaproteobacteria bacterium]|nr:CbbQ/NirQ/NorQ/GpvN family protein [Deltaproteobacteria bacterium]
MKYQIAKKIESNQELDFASELESLETTSFDAGSLFHKSPSGQILTGYQKTSIYCPKINPNYHFHGALEDICLLFTENPDPLYVFGPTGSGKTSLLKQVAARLNYPVFDVTGHSRLEFPDMVGHLTVKDGTMLYQYGPLALAVKYGGLFLLNEIDLLDPATCAGLNGILDGEPLCVLENQGEMILPSPNFRFAATANSNGAADQTGLYQGILRQNLAFMDRFRLREVGYPSQDAEREILAKASPQLPEVIRNAMISVAREIRELFMATTSSSLADQNEGVEITFSTRTILRWADLCHRLRFRHRNVGQVIISALDQALGWRATPQTRQLLHETARKYFPKHFTQS